MPAIVASFVVWVLLLPLIGCNDSSRTSAGTPATATLLSAASPTPSPVATSTATATPTAVLPDLVPLGVREVGCGVSVHGDVQCLYLILEVCAENAGGAAAGASSMRVDGRDLSVPALGAGERHCDQIGYGFGQSYMEVDVLGEVLEADESNNGRSYPQPNGTRCDTCEAKRRPAPTPAPPGRLTAARNGATDSAQRLTR